MILTFVLGRLSVTDVRLVSDWTLPVVLVSIRHFFNKEGDFNNLTAAAFHKPTHILVTGFASGIFHLHELPEFNLIHSLRSGVIHTLTPRLLNHSMTSFIQAPSLQFLLVGVIHHKLLRQLGFVVLLASSNN